jgi:hypothetical protein
MPLNWFAPGYDATCSARGEVQIKITAGKTIALRGHANAWSCSGSSRVIMRPCSYSTAPAMDFGKARGQHDLMGNAL